MVLKFSIYFLVQSSNELWLDEKNIGWQEMFVTWTQLVPDPIIRQTPKYWTRSCIFFFGLGNWMSYFTQH